MRGFIRGLHHTHTSGEPISYFWTIDGQECAVNSWLGKTLAISFLGEKRCIVCNRKVTKLYQNGYCFPCVTSLPETDLCIVKPETCHFHLGTCRDESFGTTQCMIPHYVYLGVSSQPKVGLTRKNRQFIRWVDQGAVRALLLAEIPTRKAAGELEVTIGEHLPDKTDWRKMICGVTSDVDLLHLADEVVARLPQEWKPYLLPDREVHTFEYPRLSADRIPKAKSFSLDKTPVIEGELIGIRGQYLLFDHGAMNIRKHAGFLCEITAE